MKTILRCEDLDTEPVIWFFPVVIAVMAMLISVAGAIFGLVAFFQGYFRF